MSNKKTEEELLNMKPSDILAYLDAKLGCKPDTVPEGWYTLHDLAKSWGLSDQSSGKRVNKAVAQGLLEKAMFRVSTQSSGVRPVAHYKVKK